MTRDKTQEAVLADELARDVHQHLLGWETGCSLAEVAAHFSEDDLVRINHCLSALVGAGLARNERRGNVYVYIANKV